jgi:hypothetical protein
LGDKAIGEPQSFDWRSFGERLLQNHPSLLVENPA